MDKVEDLTVCSGVPVVLVRRDILKDSDPFDQICPYPGRYQRAGLVNLPDGGSLSWVSVSRCV